MRKLIVLSIVLLCFSFFGNAQSLEETKKKLISKEWRLLRYEEGDKYYSVPKNVANTRLIFNPEGKVIMFIPPQTIETGAQFEWSINKDFLTIWNKSYKSFYKYQIKDFVGLKLYLEEIDVNAPFVEVFMEVENNSFK